jgi:hypothetical protein
MEAEEISETLVFNSTLTWLIAREDLSKSEETPVQNYITPTSCIYSPKIFELRNINLYIFRITFGEFLKISGAILKRMSVVL